MQLPLCARPICTKAAGCGTQESSASFSLGRGVSPHHERHVLPRQEGDKELWQRAISSGPPVQLSAPSRGVCGQEHARDLPGLYGQERHLPLGAGYRVRHQDGGRRDAQEGRQHSPGPARLQQREGGQGGDQRGRHGHLRAASFCGGGHPRGGGGGAGSGGVHHGGRASARHGAREAGSGAEQDASDRPQLPRHHQARRVQDRHHARLHPHQGSHRRRFPLRHAHLRGGVPDHGRGLGPEHGRRHRRRPLQRHQLCRLPRALRRGPPDRGHHHDWRDRRHRRGGGRRIHPRLGHRQARRLLHRGTHRSPRPPHGARRRHRLGRQGNRRRQDRRPRGCGRDGEPEPRADGRRHEAHLPGAGAPLNPGEAFAPSLVTGREIVGQIEGRVLRVETRATSDGGNEWPDWAGRGAGVVTCQARLQETSNGTSGWPRQ